MNHGSTNFLRAAIVLIGLVVLGVCFVILPVGIAMEENGAGYSPIVWGVYVTVIPFLIALHQTLKLLSYIDKNTAFSAASVRALGRIQYCALAIGALYAAGLPYVYLVAEQDDAPGIIVIALALSFTSLVIAVFAAVLQKLLHNAITIKSENDLAI